MSGTLRERVKELPLHRPLRHAEELTFYNERRCRCSDCLGASRAYMRRYDSTNILTIAGEKVNIATLPPELQELARLLKSARSTIIKRGASNG